MFGAVIGYEGLITKNPVKVTKSNGNKYLFDSMSPFIFKSKKLGFSNDGAYFYFISENKREVEIYIEGIRTAFNIIREVVN